MEALYSHRLAEAFAYAADLHKTQARKGTSIPYITHLMAVASIVGEAGGTENQMIAAFLHDAVEDRGGLTVLVDIENRFGKEVAEIVYGCSDSVEPEQAEKKPWEERKKAYVKHLRETKSNGILIVSCADKLHNARSITNGLRTIGPAIWERFRPTPDQSIWYYRTVANIFKEKFKGGPMSALADELDNAVNQMEALSGLDHTMRSLRS